MTRSHHARRWAALLALTATTYIACSGYDGSNRVSCPPMLIPEVACAGASAITAGASHGGAAPSAGAAGSVAGVAGAPTAGTGGTNTAGANTGGTSAAGANTAGANTAGTSGAGASGAGASGAGASGAGASGAGTGGASAGAGGASAGGPSAGNGGGEPAAGSGGSAGGSAIEQLLSEGKPASADSEETGHLAALGNDGAVETRWCAANSAANHYWQVDLGQSYALSKLTISWEQVANYQFKVEGSLDGNTWSPVLDQTQSTDASADQTYPLNGAASARYVRITTTTLPSTSIWASFFEFKVYGH
jgi:hypothetical protein